MNDNISDILKREAVERGLCRQWREVWGDCSEQELIDRYVRGIDFVIKQGEWPTNDFIKASFDPRLLHENLIFVDETVSLDDAPDGVYILNGDCTGVLRFRNWAAATVYIRHSSHIHVIAEDDSKVFVRLYDEGDADVCELGEAVVRVYDRR